MQRMSPITSECPKVLLPLVNAPLIEYMLEWMAMSGVQKVHVLCCSHADQVRAYLNNSTKWAASDMSLNIISSYNCQSAGEALRLVDQEGLIQDDFILISGDIVTNMDLSRALTQHKARRRDNSPRLQRYVLSAVLCAEQLPQARDRSHHGCLLQEAHVSGSGMRSVRHVV